MTQAEVIHGDCLEKMREKPENSQSAGVTDPPYGIRFMGKAWDGKDIEAKHAQRTAIESCDPGSDRLNRKGRKQAGPNAGYRAPAAEAGKYDRSSQASQAFQQFSREWAAEMFRVLMPGAYLVSFASTRTYHRMVCGIEDAGFEIRDQLAWIFGSGFPKSLNLEGDWEGWGTALKPGWEPIVLARKPFVGTVAANVAKWGTGALNIKGCRIGTEAIASSGAISDGWRSSEGRADRQEAKPSVSLGRWPANLMHDGSAEVVSQFPSDAGAAAPVRGNEPSAVTGDIFGERERIAGPFHDDSGSAARFFYEAKASRAERDAGCDEMPERTAAQNVNRKPGSAGMDSPRAGAQSGRRNGHPTVKPVELMRWLCRLVTPPGGRIIDPFLGSGTTGVAAVLENFDFTGIEREADYVPIARARIAEAQGPLFRTV